MIAYKPFSCTSIGRWRSYDIIENHLNGVKVLSRFFVPVLSWIFRSWLPFRFYNCFLILCVVSIVPSLCRYPRPPFLSACNVVFNVNWGAGWLFVFSFHFPQTRSSSWIKKRRKRTGLRAGQEAGASQTGITYWRSLTRRHRHDEASDAARCSIRVLN